MDDACKDAFLDIDEDTPIQSVFQGDFLRNFGGVTPGVLFADGCGEGRYAFNMNVDFFNV